MSDHSLCLSAKNLSFRYENGPWILENINFQIEKGDYIGIIGPNGGGKTTLIKLLLGLLEPTAGEIHSYCRDSQKNHRIGYVPQHLAQAMHGFPATVKDIITANHVHLWKKDPHKLAALENALSLTNAQHLEHKLIGQLSGGQLQRILIARALINNPEILILDEPTLAIDIAGKESFYKLLKELNQNKKITIIIVSHDIDAVAKEVNHVLCLNQTIVCHGKPSALLNKETLDKLYGSELQHVEHGKQHSH